MREIKFRAWIGERMIEQPYHYEVNFMSDSKMPYCCYEDWRDLEDGRSFACELMQYTGLKDKNGRECYEGDIVTLPADQLCQITWDYIGFKAIAINPPINYPRDYSYFTVKEVIGNIYENSELLQPDVKKLLKK